MRQDVEGIGYAEELINKAGNTEELLEIWANYPDRMNDFLLNTEEILKADNFELSEKDVRDAWDRFRKKYGIIEIQKGDHPEA